VLDLSDAELVKRAQGGDVNAVGALYDRYQARIFRYVQSRVFDGRLAEDLTGEIFMRMVINLPRYRATGVPFASWLYRIARNLVVDHHRKEGNFMSLPIDYVANMHDGRQHNPAPVVERQLEMERIQLALERIDEMQREVIRLRFLVGLSLQEVAEALDKTVAAVKSLQHRGLLALRVALKLQ